MKYVCMMGCFALLFTPFNGAAADTFGSGANSFGIDFVTIGHPGNPPDSFSSEPGKVDYFYRMAEFEISRDMITKANDDGDLKISMDGGTPAPRSDMPATGVSWNEAARFVNWLNTNEGYPPAYKFSAMLGDPGYRPNDDILLWEESDSGFDAANPYRNSLAHYFLPSADEWHKAAFYDPNANDGIGGYWDYPTGSDTEPTAIASGTESATAVYLQDESQGPADITQAGGLSPYGVMALAGNVREWQETEFDRINDDVSADRRTIGGSWWFNSTLPLSSSFVFTDRPTNQQRDLGFRVASLPNPCDINGDGTCDANDIDAMTQNVLAGVNTLADWTALTHKPMPDGFYTFFGDANLDGEFNTNDFVTVFQAGEYEDGVLMNSGWATGDWNADAEFDTRDFVFAFMAGGYEQGPLTDSLAVPEPTSVLLALIGVIGGAVWPRRRQL